MLVVLISDSTGLWAACGSMGVTDQQALDMCPDGHAVAIALSRWEFLSKRQATARIHVPLMDLERRRSQGNSKGFITYGLEAMAKFDYPLHVAGLTPGQLMNEIAALMAKEWIFDNRAFNHQSIRCADLVAQWQSDRSIRPPLRMCQICVGSKWLAFILTYAPIIFHCVTLCSRVPRKRLVSRNDPSAHLIKRFLDSLNPAANTEARNNVKKPRGWINQTPIDVLIEWLDFSSDIKTVDNTSKALYKAARVISKSTGRTVQDVVKECRGVSGRTLRAARVKLDSVAMLLYRMMFRCMPELIGIYLYIDSSPQLMGCEMFAASFEVFDPAGQLPFVRKLMPIIYLSRDYLDTFGKTLATIWVIFFAR